MQTYSGILSSSALSLSSEPEYRDTVCFGFLRNSTVILWTFTLERSTERGSLFPFFVLAMGCGESPRSKLQRVSSGDCRSPVRGQAVEQSVEMRSALEIFATAHSCRVFFQAFKNEVYLLPTELVEASQRTHREHSPNDVVVKVLVRSCRVYHQKSAEHQFVDRE